MKSSCLAAEEKSRTVSCHYEEKGANDHVKIGVASYRETKAQEPAREEANCQTDADRMPTRGALCANLDGHYPNINSAWFAIWHQLLRNRTERLQPRCGRGIQMRAPGKKPSTTGQDDAKDEASDAPANDGDAYTGEHSAIASECAQEDAEVGAATAGENNSAEETAQEDKSASGD
ncbi:unnamed protein product [Phytophthora fragariaefolia]|uniref:Unnamed protein product n=1 Tax=Phytophthora fragariaefolia TaxID=1490495 RepID=A0A9W6YDU8_9STRA|nr:unnamed protein product [Phytophthora fragariaefolia]